MRSRVFSVIKEILRVIGRIGLLRETWLICSRYLLCNWDLPQRWRNMIVWELATYVFGYDYHTTVQLSTGLRFNVGIDDNVNRALLLCSPWKDYIWEPQTLRLALRLQPPDGTTIVAGGHIGYDALHLAQAMRGHGGRVVVFEPVAAQFERLLQNQELSHIENMVVERIAISDCNKAEVTLYLDGPRSSIDLSHDAVSGQRVEKVRAVSLDSYAAEHDLGKVSMLFLDVEGSELKVLSGAEEILSRQPDLILEVNRPNIRSLGLAPDDLYSFLFTRGYHLFWIVDDYFFTLRKFANTEIVLHPIRTYDPNFEARLTIFNMLATCRPETLVQEGIKVLWERPIGVQ